MYLRKKADAGKGLDTIAFILTDMNSGFMEPAFSGKGFSRVVENIKNGRKIHFVSGIDTGIGKTYATAYVLSCLEDLGYDVISQKMIQTGCEGVSEDILKHRELCGKELYEEDKLMLTSPVVFSYPSSPHLAARLDEAEIRIGDIDKAAKKLCNKFDAVIQEGAGGLMVPITEDGYLTIDYIQERSFPVILVTSGRLGSINHTLLSIEACRRRNIEVELLVYNRYPELDILIEDDTFAFLEKNSGVPVVKMEECNGIW